MERFLEIILSVEREAAALEKEANSRLLEIERSYRDGLLDLTESSLAEVRQELQDERDEILGSSRQESEKIAARAKVECELLEKAQKRIQNEALRLLADTLLPPDGGD